MLHRFNQQCYRNVDIISICHRKIHNKCRWNWKFRSKEISFHISCQACSIPKYINEKSAIYPDFFIHSCHIRDPFLKKYLFLSFPLLYFFFLQSFRRHLPPLLVFFPDVAQDFLVKDKAKGYLVVALFTSTKRVKTAKTQLDP